MAERIGKMVHFFDKELALKWYKAGMTALMKHWNTIDHHRHNKFLYLIRTCLHGALELVKKCEGPYDKFSEIMKYFLDPSDLSADGAVLHIMEIYFDEISNVFEGLSEAQLSPLLEPILFVLHPQVTIKQTLSKNSKKEFVQELTNQLDRLITGEVAFLSGENKVQTTKRLLEYAKSKATSDKTRHTFYQCYKELVGFKKTVEELNVPSLAARVLGGTVAGPLKPKIMSKKYRKMQKLNKKFLKAEATGHALPKVLQELVREEDKELEKERKQEEAKKIVSKSENHAAQKKKRKEGKTQNPPLPAKKPKEEPNDIVLEVVEPIFEKKKKVKKQRPKSVEDKKKVKFDLTANTTKSIMHYFTSKNSIFTGRKGQ
eukprot:TRINITY_DN439_c0_g1_i1.p6 TRINITY_DN439_c0_g1~~TRINITY_DN439_c0_g1_i1.p6  ORF type:complete len:373 (+),score=60.98 TRINITY_DN439_c0_g1_i1:2814-3932(+)